MSETGAACKASPGTFGPRIDRNRCEGKAACQQVCPYDVFQVGTLPRAERSGLSFIGKLKGIGHRWQQALIVNGDACRACGLCVGACPEDAITLVRR
ncbi:MAG: ferredoxin family protein [Rubrivivax sp.]|nr:ferredoxin family protein [Rubrivivax sp.]